MDMQNIIKQLKASKIPDDIIDYVFENSTVLTTTYFYEYDKMLNIMFDNGLKIDDKFMINVYKFALDNNNIHNIFHFFRNSKLNLSNKNMNHIDYKIDLLIKSGMTKFDATVKFINNEIIYNSLNDEMCFNYINNLLNEYEKELLIFYQSFENNSFLRKITYILITVDYEKYITYVKSKYLNDNQTIQIEIYILDLINDDEFIKEYFIKKTLLFIKEKSKNQYNFDVERCLINYLKTGIFENDFDIVVNNFIKKISKDYYFSSYYTFFLRGLHYDFSKDFYKTLFNLSIKIALNETLLDIYYYKYQNKIENLENFIKDFNLNTILLFKSFIENFTFKHDYQSKNYEEFCISGNNDYSNKNIQQIKYMAKNYYDDCLEGIKNASNEGIVTGLKYIFEANKEKSFEFVLSFAESKSKVIRNAVVQILNGYKMLEEYKKLLNSKKAQVREIGEKLIDSLK